MSIFHRVVIALVLLVFAFAALPGFPYAQSSDFYTDCEKFPGSLGCAPVGEPPAVSPSAPNAQFRAVHRPCVCRWFLSSKPRGPHPRPQLHSAEHGAALRLVVDYMRPIILLMAAISAVFIVLPKES